MQVIGLVNTLLAKDRECLNRRLHQQRYTVTPLAPDVGLIAWMARTDPLQKLISDYRKSQHILSDLEYRLIIKVSDLPRYHACDATDVYI
jgi:serine/threonine-protein kinase mTOR